jgi:hypothetical protein
LSHALSVPVLGRCVNERTECGMLAAHGGTHIHDRVWL